MSNRHTHEYTQMLMHKHMHTHTVPTYTHTPQIDFSAVTILSNIWGHQSAKIWVIKGSWYPGGTSYKPIQIHITQTEISPQK